MNFYDPNDFDNDQTAFYPERTEEENNNTGAALLIPFIIALIAYFLA